MAVPPEMMAQMLRSGGAPGPMPPPPGGPGMPPAPPSAMAGGAPPDTGMPPPGAGPGAAAASSPDAPMSPEQAGMFLKQLGITEAALPLVAKAILTVMGPPESVGYGAPQMPPGSMPPPGPGM